MIRGVREPLGFSLASLFFNNSRKKLVPAYQKWCSRYVSPVHIAYSNSSEFFTVFGKFLVGLQSL